jgi:uncharacterized protein (DUF1330 family)
MLDYRQKERKEMTTNTGYAVEYQDGTRESVYNFATARYLVQSGNAERVYDTYFDRYVIIEVPEDSL